MAEPATPAEAQRQRILLANLELQETTDRLIIEGFAVAEVLCGLAILAHDLAAREHGVAEVPAWFHRMASIAAHLAVRGAE